MILCCSQVSDFLNPHPGLKSPFVFLSFPLPQVSDFLNIARLREVMAAKIAAKIAGWTFQQQEVRCSGGKQATRQ